MENSQTQMVSPDASHVVTLYQDANYSGTSQSLSEGAYDAKDLTVGNDQVSSLKVPDGLKVTLYEHEQFGGRSLEVKSDTPWIGDAFNDIVSSVKVEKTSQAPLVKVPSVFSFNGVDNILTAPLNISETDYTVSIWFKTTNPECGIFSAGASQTINIPVFDADESHMETMTVSVNQDRHLYLSNGAICARLWSNETIAGTSNTLADGRWHKVTHVFGGGIGGQRLYVDGKLEASGNKSSSDLFQQNNISIGYSRSLRAIDHTDTSDISPQKYALFASRE